MAQETAQKLPTGSLVIAPAKDGSGFYWEAKWRSPALGGKQAKRRVGRAHVKPRTTPRDVQGWSQWFDHASGKPSDGVLKHDDAVVEKRKVIAAFESDVKTRAADQEARATLETLPTFEDAAAGWLKARRAQTNAKAKTLDDWASMLRREDDTPRKRGRQPSARLMTRFGDERIDTITAQDVTAFLDELDDFGLAPRTINKYRSVIAGIYKWAARSDTCGFQHNPVSPESKRKEADPGELVTYTPEHVQAITRTLREGGHRGARMRAGGQFSKPENRAERTREDEQDATAVIVAAFAGLRLGELIALRWRDVDFTAERIRVQRAYVMGELTSTKGRKARSVPMSEQVAEVLAKLGQREHFTAADDHVFAGADGDFIDGGALARRYKRARDAVRASDASVPELRWHDLRHTFGSLCAAAGVDVVSIQSWLGHTSIRTTQRYMHHAPSAGDAERLSRAFGGTAAEVKPNRTRSRRVAV